MEDRKTTSVIPSASLISDHGGFAVDDKVGMQRKPSCDAFLRGVPSPVTDVVERARLNTTRTDLYITMMRSSKE